METQARVPNYLDLDSTTNIPAPLADVLTTLGSYESQATGHHHHIITPERPENWHNTYWQVDDDLITEWTQLCNRVQHHYTMKCFPKEDDYEKRPIMLTTREQQQAPRNTHVRIKAYTNEPQQNDALIRTVNDDLFEAAGEWTAQNCHYYMTPALRTNQVVQTYIGGYVLRDNA